MKQPDGASKPVERIDCREFCQPEDPVKFLVDGYCAKSKDYWHLCISNKYFPDENGKPGPNIENGKSLPNIDECVFGCIVLKGERLKPAHSHQKRIPKDTLSSAVKMLLEAFKDEDLSRFKDFEDLYDFVEKHTPGKGFKQICIYDAALRMAASNMEADPKKDDKLMPKDYVYLHCGAYKGALALWKMYFLDKMEDKKGIPYFRYEKKPKPNSNVKITCFHPFLQALGATYLEDFLCVCHLHLEGLFLRKLVHLE